MLRLFSIDFLPSNARLALFTALVYLVAGCSLLPGTDQAPSDSGESAAIEASESEQATQETPAASRPFEPGTLYNLLVGELSVYTRDIDTAANNYYREAINTRDAAVAARAARLTRYQRDTKSALAMAELWYELDPDKAGAAENLADMYTRTNQPERALDILEAQFQRGQKTNFSTLRNSKLAAGSEALTNILERLKILSEQDRQDNFSLLFSYTVLLQKNLQHADALAQLSRLKDFDTDPVQLALIEAQLLAELERDSDATNVLQKALKKYPDERRLQLAYARKLTKTDLPLAEELFANLLLTTPSDARLLKSHALVAAENKHYQAAKNSLEKLLPNRAEASFSRYNLGLIAEAEDDHETALGHFEKVQPGDYYLPATKKIATILAARGQLQQAQNHLAALRKRHPRQAPNFWIIESHVLRDLDQLKQAHAVLGTAIEQFPEHKNLRFERSQLSEKLDDIALTEHDLRTVLEREPDNVTALNALGYTLADRTDRYTEALVLIEKAIALRPDDAAIIDSLGWVQFRLGQTEKALKNLERAFDMYPDDEIAAHLIEVYWAGGQKKKARRIFKQMQKQGEQIPLIDATLQRLDINF